MKKEVFILSLAILVTGLALVVFIVKFKTSPKFPPRGITLNAVSAADANLMVSKFRTDVKCSDKKIAFWLNKNWVENVYSIIKGEGGDGFRIYFAKTLDKRGKNTVVITSTYNEGPDNPAESKFDHMDYFEHNNPFFVSNDADLTEDWTGTTGAELFDPNYKCPAKGCTTTSNNHISCDNAYQAVQNFLKQPDNQEINTYSEWFSIKLLKTIRDDLRDRTKSYPNQPGDGIRIYFALHTSSQAGAPPSTNPHHPDRHAFIIITTYADKGYHWDYFDCPPKESFLSQEYFDSSDNGEQCLNNCKGATLPAP